MTFRQYKDSLQNFTKLDSPVKSRRCTNLSDRLPTVTFAEILHAAEKEDVVTLEVLRVGDEEYEV